MSDAPSYGQHIERRLRETEERFRVAQAVSGIGWFEWDLTTDTWEWTSPVASLFGFDPFGCDTRMDQSIGLRARVRSRLTKRVNPAG
jgi:hypothetical protein